MSNAAPRFLLLRIELHEPRFHGRPEWPPAPSRAFQALVAAAGKGRGVDEAAAEALRWLEGLSPPQIGAPRQVDGAEAVHFVPNNDLDSKGGDPALVGEIRAAKVVRPRLLESGVPFIYIWSTDDASSELAERICAIAESMYQFGRGVDMAWASGRVANSEELDAELGQYRGVLLRPSPGRGARTLQCPHPGSLARLEERFDAMARRFATVRDGRRARQSFSQPPMVSFRSVEYGGESQLRVFEFRNQRDPDKWAALPLARAHEVVTSVRDQLLAPDLLGALGAQVQACVRGRSSDDSVRASGDGRLHLIPLPSIGHEHSDLQIRRIAVRLPLGGPLDPADVNWALARIGLADSTALQFAPGGEMLRRYTSPSRIWRTVTAAVLPRDAGRRRLDPSAIHSKAASERSEEERQARAAVLSALRHARIHRAVQAVRVQREPFSRKGQRAESFSAETRFEKTRMWHVEVEFTRAVAGPLVIGDGRFLGLGVMAAASNSFTGIAFEIESGLADNAEPGDVAHALRRAVLARCQAAAGPGKALSPLITGHDQHGAPARDSRKVHYMFDPEQRRLLLLVRAAEGDCEVDTVLGRLRSALDGFVELRAGPAGSLKLREQPLRHDDVLLRRSREWRTATPYLVHKHYKMGDARAAVEVDVRTSCTRAGLPRPEEVHVEKVQPVPGRGLTARIRLVFGTEVAGPLLLGRSRFKGGGLFKSVKNDGD